MEDRSGSATPALKLAFGIAYAMLRFSGTLKHKALANRLEEYAFRIAREVASEHYSQTAKTIEEMNFFVRLAGSSGLMKFENSQVIIAESKKLADEMQRAASEGEADIAKLFKKEDGDVAKQSGNASGNKRQTIRVKEVRPAEQAGHQVELAQEVRQSAILQRIRQFGNCRIKDFEDILPNVSERTLRYDLQRLAEQGVIERVGAGGPFSHYRLKTAVLPHGFTHPDPIPAAPPSGNPAPPEIS